MAIEKYSGHAFSNETPFGSAFLLNHRRFTSQELNEVLAVFNELANLLFLIRYHAKNIIHFFLSLTHFL